jgi:hypothetical protein
MAKAIIQVIVAIVELSAFTISGQSSHSTMMMTTNPANKTGAKMSQTPIPLESLYGTWKLISQELTDIEVKQTFAFDVGAGYITYARDGRMMAMIVEASRPMPQSMAAISDQQRIDLFSTMTAYGGTFEFDGHTVKHHVDVSWNQLWTGTTVIRDVVRDGDRLVFRTRPAPNAINGKSTIRTLVWEKLAHPA